MKTYIVQLEDHDDIISARDKISWSKARRVLLVWPREGRVLDRRLDVLLLLRCSRQVGSQLAFVTRDGEVKAHARELGIPVFSDPVQAQESGWRRLRRRKSPRQKRAPVSPASLREQRELLHEAPAENRRLRLVMFTVGVLSFLILALFFIPGAQVQLEPLRKTQSLTLPVWASPSIRVPNASGGLPARAVTVLVEGRSEADSTGSGKIPFAHAGGQVLLTNFTDQPVDVPEGSILLSTGDPAIHYQSTLPVTVPAGTGKSILVAVQAVAAGSAGNLPVGSIRAMEGPAGLRVSVENQTPITGGAERAAPAPTEGDYRALREKLLQELEGNALEEIRTRLKTGQRLLDGTLRLRSVVKEAREPAAGQPADRLQMSLQAEFAAWYIDESDLQTMAEGALSASLAPGFRPVPGSLQFDFITQPAIESQSAAGLPAKGDASPEVETPMERAGWKLRIQRELEASWSKESVIEAILGKHVQEAKRILGSKIPLKEEPHIVMYPGWWTVLPYLPARIQVVKK